MTLLDWKQASKGGRRRGDPQPSTSLREPSPPHLGGYYYHHHSP